MKLTVNDTTSAITLLQNGGIFIPAYQRPYRWGSDKSRQLFKDVSNYLKSQGHDLFETVNSSKTDRIEYFTGATVTTSDEKLTEVEVIDGQQRTTTFFLAALLKYMITARMLRERIDAKQPRAPEFIEKTIDAWALVFTSDESYGELIKLKSRLDDESLSFDEFLDKSRSLIDSLTSQDKAKCDWGLKIRYARTRISNDLQNALARGCSLSLNDNRLELKVSPSVSFPSESYQTTLESCLEWINDELKQTEIKSSYALLNKAEMLLSNFIDVACVCNIKADNQKDAYTLFEILNDRSEPLKDLEIAKNLFYKFVFNSDFKDDEKTDEQLDIAEGHWTDAFENGNIEDIVYLAGTMAITQDFELDFKKGQLAELRKAITIRLKSRDQYTLAEVIDDFSVYREIGQFLNLHYHHQLRAQAVVNEIFEDSSRLKTISLKYFLALKQNKIVALLSVILLSKKNESLLIEIAKLSILYSIKSLGSIDLLENLKSIAKNLNNEEAIKGLISIFKEKINKLEIKNEYSNWSYTKSNHVIILKSALALYAASNGEKLGYYRIDLTKLPNWKNPKEFDLDHIIPKSKFDSVVTNSDESEGSQVNSLGNMMLLGSSINRTDKSNSIEFIYGTTDQPSPKLCNYTLDTDLDSSIESSYLKGIRNTIAKHNIPSPADKISEQLVADVRAFNLKVIATLVNENIT